MQPPRIKQAKNDLLITEDGHQCIDLFTAHGTTWLGHNNKDVARRISEQMDRIWITGGLETAVSVEAKGLVDAYFPPSHGLAGFYSTGMEAAEVAIRIARVVKKKNGVVGFENSTHGKSMATAYLGWDNRDNVYLPEFYRLPFVQTTDEDKILWHLEEVLSRQPVAAVFVEPLQGSGGGHRASSYFYKEVLRMCRKHDALLVFDEILTGIYRTGKAFFFSDLGFVPDIVLIGKAMGNGFPVSGVVVNSAHRIQKQMLTGSTYAGNPLAAAAVAATLQIIRNMKLPERVARIERTITEYLDRLQEIEITPRGKGALWIIEVPPELNVEHIVASMYRAGVMVGYAGRQIRLLPAATIELENLEKACSVITETLIRGGHNGR